MGKVKQAEIAELPDDYELYPDEDDDAATSMPGMRTVDAGLTLFRVPATQTPLHQAEPLDPQT